MTVLAEQSACMILALDTTQQWIKAGQKATGQAKDLLGKIIQNMREKNLDVSPSLQAVITSLM